MADLIGMRSDGSDPMRLTRDTSNDTMPAWSPDGLAYRLCV